MSSEPGSQAACRLALADSTPRLQGAAGPATALPATDALLLAWLALEGPTPRERLAELLWPEKDAASSRNALRQRLFRLRRTAGHPLLRGTTVLELHPDVQHDLHASATILGAMQPRLNGEIDTWLAAQRASRQAGVRRGLEERIQALESSGDYAHALPLALTLLQAHPHSEDAHRRVIRLHYLRGDRAAALLAFDRCEHVLKHDVGATPSLETLELLATIEQQDVVDRTPARFGRVPLVLQRPPRLIGRDAEIDALRRAWGAGSHTLVLGIPGLGRTRLLEWLAQYEPGTLCVTLPHDTSGWPLAAARRIVSALMRRASPALTPDLVRQLEALLDPSSSRRPLHAQSMADPYTLQIEELISQWSTPVTELLEASGLEVVAVDDVHRADAVSMALIEALTEHAAVRWCLSMRLTPPGTPGYAFRAGMRADGRCTEVFVRRIDAASLTRFLASLEIDGLEPAEATTSLHALTGGHPQFVLEALRLAWRENGLKTGSVQWPPAASFTPRTAVYLAGLSPAALQLARVAAAAGPRFSAGLAATVLGCTPLALADAWAELDCAQLLDGEMLASQIVQEALRSGIPAPLAADLQARIERAGSAQG